MWFVYLQNNKP